MHGTICAKALILAHCSDSNERLNGFDLAILGFRFFGLVLLDCFIVLVYY